MNEQIRKLAEQAKFTWVENDKDITGGVALEKFAELIVRECITVLKNNIESYDSRAMFLMSEMTNTSESILLKHFGVEV